MRFNLAQGPVLAGFFTVFTTVAPAHASSYRTEYSFHGVRVQDGQYPEGSLIAVGGKLYGTTDYGGKGSCGSNGCGTVFWVSPKANSEKVVYSFRGFSGH